jgi:hypothetical protein
MSGIAAVWQPMHSVRITGPPRKIVRCSIPRSWDLVVDALGRPRRNSTMPSQLRLCALFRSGLDVRADCRRSVLAGPHASGGANEPI